MTSAAPCCEINASPTYCSRFHALQSIPCAKNLIPQLHDHGYRHTVSTSVTCALSFSVLCIAGTDSGEGERMAAYVVM